MTFSKQMRLAVLFVSTLIVGACTADTSLRTRVASYLDDNITELSPRTATQGSFRVSSVEWVDDDTVRVTYSDDAGVVLHAIGDVNENSSRLITTLRIDTSFSSSSSSIAATSSSSSALSNSSSSVRTTSSSDMSDTPDSSVSTTSSSLSMSSAMSMSNSSSSY